VGGGEKEGRTRSRREDLHTRAVWLLYPLLLRIGCGGKKGKKKGGKKSRAVRREEGLVLLTGDIGGGALTLFGFRFDAADWRSTRKKEGERKK